VNVSRLFIITLFSSGLLLFCSPPVKALPNSPVETTLAYFRQVPCLEEEQYHYYKDIIRALSYTRMRAFRAFCSLPGISADEAIASLRKLVFYPVRFDQVEILEMFFKTGNATFTSGWTVLEKTAGLKFTAGQAAAELKGSAELEADRFLSILDTLQTLDDSGCWAARALFGVPGISGPSVVRGLTVISSMNDRQHLAVEKACNLFSKDPQHIPTLLESLQHLSETEANTVAALFSSEQITPRNGLDWLQNYFALPPGTGDQHFIELPDTKKSQLLAAFSDGADYLIWKLNNLHSVTDE